MHQIPPLVDAVEHCLSSEDQASSLSASVDQFIDVNNVLLARYHALFPHYVWTDPISAIDLLAAEIHALRAELVELKGDK